MDQFELEVFTLVRKYLPSSTILDRYSSLQEHKLDSLKLVQLIMDLEEALSIEFQSEQLERENFASIDTIIACAKAAPAN